MNIENNQNIPPFIFNPQIETPEEKNPIVCEASYSSFDECLVVNTDNTEMYDAIRTYYINKDGSGILRTNFGKRQYPPETFNSVLNLAKEMAEKNGYLYSYDESLKLLDEINQTLKK